EADSERLLPAHCGRPSRAVSGAGRRSDKSLLRESSPASPGLALLFAVDAHDGNLAIDRTLPGGAVRLFGRRTFQLADLVEFSFRIAFFSQGLRGHGDCRVIIGCDQQDMHVFRSGISFAPYATRDDHYP